ncbi:hypothetical protein H312_01483 [Anncaliia algerae PRA339]|uniref:Uncharacterized protein n=1 Tax=Anncaliia algerae PRA339 TaxID=1288291 RepID=A0A059F205_9MICR|nr:hypothetical protein H312_01483 [Anncaliia algerae PRA339]
MNKKIIYVCLALFTIMALGLGLYFIYIRRKSDATKNSKKSESIEKFSLYSKIEDFDQIKTKNQYLTQGLEEKFKDSFKFEFYSDESEYDSKCETMINDIEKYLKNNLKYFQQKVVEIEDKKEEQKIICSIFDEYINDENNLLFLAF